MTESQSIGDISAVTFARWRWWQDALNHPNLIGSATLPIHESDPQQGYYRVKTKAVGWEPVSIFYPEDSNTIVAQRNGLEVRDVETLWTWCCQNPISYEAYQQAVAGGGFADEPKRARSIGDNSKDADDCEALRIEYLGEKETAEEFMKKPIKAQDDADKAAIWSKRLSDITKRAEEFHSIEKRHHLDAGKAVDDKWRSLKDDPKALSTKLKRHIDEFAREQRQIEEERARVAREEEARLRREVDEAIRKANESDQQSNAEREQSIENVRLLQAEADRKSKETVVQNFHAGRTGAKVATRTFKFAFITDYDQLVNALKGRDEVKELITSLANRAAKGDFQLAGMEIKSEERVV